MGKIRLVVASTLIFLSRIKISIHPEGGKPMTFAPKVLDFENQKIFRWKGVFLIPGLFDGEHIFELKRNHNGTTTLNHRENFYGIMVPFMKKQLNTAVKAGFNAMNIAVKERAESLN
ncbi:MAG: SRPBCC domain-containing protein [Cryomorphaceae bacterium]|nr:SRPBCC domain-containing protein [Cryomorphaceae bacterium]